MENIEHLVVVMFENRSFDNLLGWLYDNESNPPKYNIPPQAPPTFDGLATDTFFNLIDPVSSNKVFAARPPTSWPTCPNANQVPTPDPHETFEHVTAQIYGKASPSAADEPNMSGFLSDYSTTEAGLASANHNETQVNTGRNDSQHPSPGGEGCGDTPGEPFPPLSSRTNLLLKWVQVLSGAPDLCWKKVRAAS